MSIASEISRITGNIADAYTAASGKGATMPATQNSDNLASTISSITTGGGGKYELLSRVKDDSDNDVGIVVGYHTDANNQKYAVVCLNKQYRTSTTLEYLSMQVNVDGIPNYLLSTAYSAPETATKNCDEIIATATAQSLSCWGVRSCRSQSFLIGGVTYYGQLPNCSELLTILINETVINQNDPSSTGPDISATNQYWSSTQGGTTTAFGTNAGPMAFFTKNMSAQIIPILEIPIN